MNSVKKGTANKNIIAILSIVTLLVVAAAVVQSFYRYHPGKNPDAKRPEVVIYVSSSFLSPFGPGEEIKKEFEKHCLCEVRYEDVGGALLGIERIKLNPRSQVDVIMGLDLLTLGRIFREINWRDVTPPARKWKPHIEENLYPKFLPYNWSPMTLIYREGELEPKTQFSQLENLPRSTLALQDAKMSSPGLQFVYWSFLNHKDKETLRSFFSKLKPAVHSISPDWTAAYGLFRQGHAKAVFSYLTSLVYHEERGETQYKAMVFEKGHPAQIEYAGVPNSCYSCALGERFVQFLTSDFAQKVLMEKNYMLPVVENISSGTPYAKLPSVKLFDKERLDEFSQRQKEILEVWEKSLR